MKTIKFYTTAGAYGCFSNFSPHPVYMCSNGCGKRYPTSEHYYQSQKFTDEVYQELIRNAPTPKVAASLGRSRDLPLREDWEAVKDSVMFQVVLAKFTQHESLRETLLDTGTAYLVEHTTNDSYWGDGGNGRGQNMLGKILMIVRGQL